MEKLTRYFFLLSMLLLVVTGSILFRESRTQWKEYQETYKEYLLEKAATTAEKEQAGRYVVGVKQIWLPELDRADRCSSCHAGVDNPDGPRQPPLAPHPDVTPHSFEKFGCSVCHEGKGVATRLPDAHEKLTPPRMIEASCGKCHYLEGPGREEAPTYTSGYLLLDRMGCRGCHILEGDAKKEFHGPSLSGINSKVSREWLLRWLQTPKDYLTDPRMANFLLSRNEVEALTDFLLKQELPEETGASFYGDLESERKILSDLSDDDLDEIVEQGKELFGRLRCLSCHTLNGKGGTIGPDLTPISRKTNRNWLSSWIRSPATYNPHTRMPTFNMNTMERLGLVEYLLSESEFSMLDEDEEGSDHLVSDGGPTEEQNVQYDGRQIFLTKGCVNCHQLPEMKPNPEFAPPLKNLAGKETEKIDFGRTEIPRTLPDYIAVKLQSPRIYGDKLKMPDFDFNPEEVGRLTTLLLGRTGSIPSSYIPGKPAPDITEPAGEVGGIFDRYKCLSCHKFGGRGGELAPDLTYEGSKVRKEWLRSYLEKPYAIRPYLIERMPRFNMAPGEVETLAQYFELVLRNNEIDAAVQTQQGNQDTGRKLYADKYVCQACHSIDGTGGYYGPALENVADRLKTSWLATRLVTPHPYEPGAREPALFVPREDRTDILAFLLTLKTEQQQ